MYLVYTVFWLMRDGRNEPVSPESNQSNRYFGEVLFHFLESKKVWKVAGKH